MILQANICGAAFDLRVSIGTYKTKFQGQTTPVKMRVLTDGGEPITVVAAGNVIPAISIKADQTY